MARSLPVSSVNIAPLKLFGVAGDVTKAQIGRRLKNVENCSTNVYNLDLESTVSNEKFNINLLEMIVVLNRFDGENVDRRM